jgi:hypothetical protein
MKPVHSRCSKGISRQDDPENRPEVSPPLREQCDADDNSHALLVSWSGK